MTDVRKPRRFDSSAIEGVLYSPPAGGQQLKNGCYFVDWQPVDEAEPLHGTIRLEIRDGEIVVSGDLYEYHRIEAGKSVELLKQSLAEKQIPAFPIDSYKHYLQILGFDSDAERIKVRFSCFTYFNEARMLHHTDEMSFDLKIGTSTGGDLHPQIAGKVLDSDETIIASVKMFRVSDRFRRANIAIVLAPSVNEPESPLPELNWDSIFAETGWDIHARVRQSADPRFEKEIWNNAELHKFMEEVKSQVPDHIEWYYFVLCIPRHTDSRRFGIMFDHGGGDTDNFAREGAAVCCQARFGDNWGRKVDGRILEDIQPAYFRTAIHEVGHMMGLIHSSLNRTFMNETSRSNFVSEADPKPFPHNIEWQFSAEDRRRLCHMPDIWVRPGGIKWNADFEGHIAIMSPTMRLPLALTAAPVAFFRGNDEIPEKRETDYPYGAPVRIAVRLSNTSVAGSGQTVSVPADLALKGGNILISVRTKDQDPDSVEPVVLSSSVFYETSEQETTQLAPGKGLTHSYTLLHHKNRALFPEPGDYFVEVTFSWRSERDIRHVVRANFDLRIAEPVDDEQKRIAEMVLATSDVTRLMVIGGDDFAQGQIAVQAALGHPELGPHFSFIEAKRLSRQFFNRQADPDQACAYLKKYDYIAINGVELKQAAEVVLNASRSSTYQMPVDRRRIEFLSRSLRSRAELLASDGTISIEAQKVVEAILDEI